MKMTFNQSGSIAELTGESITAVIYSLTHVGLGDAYGMIAIGDDPQPGDRFMGNPSKGEGQKNYHLITANKTKVGIFFRNRLGAFVCVASDEAKEALK